MAPLFTGAFLIYNFTLPFLTKFDARSMAPCTSPSSDFVSSSVLCIQSTVLLDGKDASEVSLQAAIASHNRKS